MLTKTPLIISCLILTACTPEVEESHSIELKSQAAMNDLVACISQNYDGAFPRFFPAGKNGSAKAFRTYNGIEVEVTDEGNEREISLRWMKRPTEVMRQYLDKCALLAEEL